MSTRATSRRGRLILLAPRHWVDTLAHRVQRLRDGIVYLCCGATVSAGEARPAPKNWSDICMACEDHCVPGDVVTHVRAPNYPGHRVRHHYADVVTMRCGLRLPQPVVQIQKKPWPVHKGCRG